MTGASVSLRGRSMARLLGGWSRERSILLLVFLAATVIRAIPGWMNAAWGNDFGIYYGITTDFVENPELFRPYTGWGASYNYFPVLYVIVGALHVLTGAEVVWLMPRVAPVFGGIAVLLFYLVVREMTGDGRLALVSTAFLAVNPFHVYQTSHAAPLTVGHMFMVLCLYLFFKRQRGSVTVGALYVSSILLVASHHLTTFFYLIAIVFVTLYRNAKRADWTEDLAGDLFYIVAISGFTFAYWMLIATPVYRGFISAGLLVPPWAILLGFYLGLALLFSLVWLCRRAGLLPLERKRLKVRLWHCIALSVLATSLFVLAFSFANIPGTGFRFDESAVIYLLPQLVALGFALYGYGLLADLEWSASVKGWLYPIAISMLLTTMTWHKTLFPFRHLEYIAYPVSILAGAGAYFYWKGLADRSGVGVVGGRRRALAPRTFAQLVAVLLVLNLASAYAVQRTTSRYEESISDQVFEVIDWMEGNVTGTDFTVATDHRISQLLWAEGYNATDDAAYDIWFATSWIDCLGDLEQANGSKPRIMYVLIDDVMLYHGIQSNINETPRNMTASSYAKFAEPPFELVHRAVDERGVHWAELYEVDWQYIEENTPA